MKTIRAHTISPAAGTKRGRVALYLNNERPVLPVFAAIAAWSGAWTLEAVAGVPGGTATIVGFSATIAGLTTAMAIYRGLRCGFPEHLILVLAFGALGYGVSGGPYWFLGVGACLLFTTALASSGTRFEAESDDEASWLTATSTGTAPGDFSDPNFGDYAIYDATFVEDPLVGTGGAVVDHGGVSGPDAVRIGFSMATFLACAALVMVGSSLAFLVLTLERAGGFDRAPIPVIGLGPVLVFAGVLFFRACDVLGRLRGLRS